jgi:isopenicillin N synthase-like dioxygenase
MLEKTGVYVLRALALRLGLDEFYFDNCQDGNSILRPIHYPPHPGMQMLFVLLLMVIST